MIIVVSKKLKEGESDIEGVNNSYRVINDAMNDWMEIRMSQNLANGNYEVMNGNQYLVVG